MTISSTTVKNSYSGNGTLDTFNYTFKVFADADVQVIIRDASATETVKTLTTHYTVTGAGSASGGAPARVPRNPRKPFRPRLPHLAFGSVNLRHRNHFLGIPV